MDLQSIVALDQIAPNTFADIQSRHIVLRENLTHAEVFSADVEPTQIPEYMKAFIAPDCETYVSNRDWGVGLDFVSWSPSEEVMIYYHLWQASFHCQVLGKDAAKLRTLATLIHSDLPLRVPQGSDWVDMAFWSTRLNGNVVKRSRRITVPGWEEIKANYRSTTRGALQSLIDLDPHQATGRLLLLHGKPGTGKTFTVRALAKEWTKWCQPEYVVDPEHFFANSEYMLSVLIDDSEQPSWHSSEEEEEPKWRLLIIEDADEFLTVDAKERQGQALSRLLNITDGLLGQGLRHLILMTTNEPMDKIHPAIQRRGRCLANISFLPFETTEAQNWLTARGYKGRAPDNASLADLYNVLEDQQQIKSLDAKERIGFGRN